MKKTAALIEKLIRLANGEALPSSALKGDWFEQMQTDGVLIAVTKGSRKSFRVADKRSFRHYLESQYDLRDLEATHEILSQNHTIRAAQVTVTGDSKFVQRRTFKGFLLNCYQPIDAILNGHPIVIHPIDGSFLFVSDFHSFSIPEEVVVVGVENAENFRYIESQRHLFQMFGKVLFVSRYPQEQHNDLIQWLKSIPNLYVHFGDLDLAGIAIYQNEFYKHLGERATFFVPNDYEERVANGNRERYNDQVLRYGKMKAEDPRVAGLLACIHRHHRGYDQEGFLGFSLSSD